VPPSSTLSAATPQATGLYERLAALDPVVRAPDARREALDRFFRLKSRREKTGRFWRIDFDSIVPDPRSIDQGFRLSVETGDPVVRALDLPAAAREHPAALARAMGATGIAAGKFGALADAFAARGVFIHVPADHACDEPIVIRYHADAATAIFPYTVVLAERGARVTIVERLGAETQAFVCGATEIVTEDHADVSYAVLQQAKEGSRVIALRAARPGRDARIAWASADLGGELAAGELRVNITQPGAEARLTALFFPRASQHVDLVSTVEHEAGEASSETMVKSAARERGQARFLGNIRIAPHAQGSDARLRDDVLVLSPTAHVDSVPALEIGANDVKAYHGATVGTIDEEQVFYMQSRGIDAAAAGRMIALGFFEPAVERFPSARLRDEIRAELAGKLS